MHALAGAVLDRGDGVQGGVEPLRGDLRPPVRVHVAARLVAQGDGERRDGDREGGEEDAEPHGLQVIGRRAAIFRRSRRSRRSVETPAFRAAASG